MKGMTRRGFLKISGATAAGVALGSLGFDLRPIEAYAQTLRIKDAKQTTTVCPYCAVGCGIIVHTSKGKVLYTEGDPDHPINEGALCSKGISVFQLSGDNPNRLSKPMYRAPFGTEWKEVSWEFALDKIAENVKKVRDQYFETTNQKGQTVNRLTHIASVGSAAMDNEECNIYQKFLRSLGLVYIEHQARI